MAFGITGPAEITPAFQQVALASNYIDFNSGSGSTFAQQYLPELYESEVEIYGNRTIGGFLKMVGAESPMTSDQVIWSEQGRLHISYTGVTLNVAGGVETITLPSGHAVRQNALIVVSDGTNEYKAFVSSVTDTTIVIKPYAAAVTGIADATAVNLFVFGSEFGKGTDGMSGAIEPTFHTYSNKPVIIKDYYEVSGSDVAQIGWVEVSTENGQTGYLWYLKAEAETRLRYEDYLEMQMVEAEKKQTGSTAPEGTEGLFAAVTSRGNVSADFVPGAGTLGDFDTILAQLDTQGAIQENMIFADRGTNLGLDDMLASINATYNGGASYGVFNNSEQMSLNLGFTGFRRGSYDFYKTDWKYLNDVATRGGIVGSVKGIMVPAGTSTEYDEQMGRNVRRPFLHTRYRASEADNRKMKSWVVGSVGGAKTSGLDAMQIHFLSERCLVVQGANNFVLLK